MKILVLGAGNMARAFFSKWTSTEDELSFYTPSGTRAYELAKLTHGNAIARWEEIDWDDYDVLVLAFKPQQLKGVTQRIPKLNNKPCIISFLAAISLEQITISLGLEDSSQIIRLMPNTPTSIAEGCTTYVRRNTKKDKCEMKLISFFNQTGMMIELEKEEWIDLLTPINGSGPGWLFWLADALNKYYLEKGLPKEVIAPLVSQTFLGSSKMLAVEAHIPDLLMNQVTSKNGITQEIIETLGKNRVDELIGKAMEAGHQRAKAIALGN